VKYISIKYVWALQVMMRLKNSRNLDARQNALLDNAYFTVRPPKRAVARRKRRAPEQEYMRYLVRECLAKEQVKPVSNTKVMMTTRGAVYYACVCRPAVQAMLTERWTLCKAQALLRRRQSSQA
jgi:hypothetical protein